MTPLLARLDKELADSDDTLVRAKTLAARACYLARIGEFFEANAITLTLRRTYGNGDTACVLIWIMLIEGLVLYFDAIDERARDRLVRAQALSSACGLFDLHLTTTAWLSHIDFNQGQFDSMVDSLSICGSCLAARSSGWKTRFYLVLADALLYCGENKSARSWYDRARQNAVDEGDQATIGAIIYNRSALSLTHARVLLTSGPLHQDIVSMVCLEVESAFNYQQHTRQRSLTQLMDLCRARAFMLQGRIDEAACILQELLGHDRRPQNFRSDWIVIYLEYAFCLCAVGKREAATEFFLRSDPRQSDTLDADDQIIFFSKYLQVAASLHIEVDVERFEKSKSDALAIYKAAQSKLGLRLAELLEKLPITLN